MPNIEIDYALSGSDIPMTGFIADGTFDNGGNDPAGLVCKLIPTVGLDITGTATFDTPNGSWSATFPTLSPASGYRLQAVFTGATPDEQPNLTVVGNNMPDVQINPLPPPPGPLVAALAGGTTAPVTVSYTVTGKFNQGVAVICLAVKLQNKKIKSVDAAASATMNFNAKTWSASLDVERINQGEKRVIVALLIDENGRIIAKNIRRRVRR